MHDDAARWDQRYAGTGPAEACPPAAIEMWPELVGLLPDTGRGLDIASGRGGVTLWLAQRRFEMTALDASRVATELLETAATAAGVADCVDARTFDLDDGLPDELGQFDLIVCQRFRDPRLYTAMIDRLAPDAIGIVTVLSSVGSPDPGPFHAPAGELSVAFGSDERCELLRSHEGEGIAHVVIRRR